LGYTLKSAKWPLTAAALCATLLTGCKDFFVSNSGGGGGGGTTTKDAIYVGNSTSTTLAGYSISSTDGSLSAVSGSPVSVGVNVTSMAVTPSNSYLYAGSSGGYVYVYSVATTGVLTLGHNNDPVAASIIPASMKVDSTGQWLILADSAGQQIISYAIDTSTGALTSIVSQIAFNDTTGTPTDLVITPNNGYIYVSLGKAGVDIYALNSTTGVLTYAGHLKTLATSNADRGMAVDANNAFLFITETNTKGLRVMTIGNNGALTEISGSPFTTGNGPIAVAVDPTNTYVYVANYADSNISGFTLATSGVLTALGSSPYTTGTSPIDIAFDKSKTYLAVACAGSNPDLQTFKLDSATLGKLDPVAKATTGKSSAAGNPVSLAVTRY
jgi:6-phosphogluconolactonase (cycloisomerase 2 family)